MNKAMIALFALLLVALAPIAAAEAASENDSSVSVDSGVGREKADTKMRTKISVGKPVDQKERMKDLQDLKETKANRASMKEERSEMRDLSESLRGCKGKKTDDCEQKRKGAKFQVKTVLEKAANDVTSLLEKSKARISDSALEGKDSMMSDIDVQLNAIADAKAKIGAINENSTREEIKAVTKNLRDAMHDARMSLHGSVFHLIDKRLGGVIEKSKNLEKRLEESLAKLQSNGVDTSSVNLDAFKAKLDSAAAAHASATALFEQSKSASGQAKADLMQQATDKIRESHASLKEAHQLLKDILSALKGLNEGSKEHGSDNADAHEANESTEDQREEADEGAANAANVSTNATANAS